MLPCFFLLLTNTASALETRPTLDTTLAATYWRLGLQADVRYGIHAPFPEKEGALFENTGIKTLATLAASPAFVRGGGRVILSPLAIMDVHLHGAYDQYFGNFQTVVGYTSPSENYGTNDEIATYVDDTSNQLPGSGYHVGAQFVLKAKAGPVVVLASTDWTYMDIRSEVEGSWFFERDKELMLALEGDSVIDFNGLVLYQHDRSEGMIRVGSFTTRRSSAEASDTMLRTGLICSFNGGGNITHNLISQVYLQDRAFTDPFPPYFAYAMKVSR